MKGSLQKLVTSLTVISVAALLLLGTPKVLWNNDSSADLLGVYVGTLSYMQDGAWLTDQAELTVSSMGNWLKISGGGISHKIDHRTSAADHLFHASDDGQGPVTLSHDRNLNQLTYSALHAQKFFVGYRRS